MKIKCVKTAINKPEDNVLNSNMGDYLIVGRHFCVFGIRFFKSITYVYIFNNEHLFEVPFELFEIVDNKLSKDWIIKKWNNEEVTLWPEIFYNDGFFENFAERESNEREIFEHLRIEIEK